MITNLILLIKGSVFLFYFLGLECLMIDLLPIYLTVFSIVSSTLVSRVCHAREWCRSISNLNYAPKFFGTGQTNLAPPRKKNIMIHVRRKSSDKDAGSARTLIAVRWPVAARGVRACAGGRQKLIHRSASQRPGCSISKPATFTIAHVTRST